MTVEYWVMRVLMHQGPPRVAVRLADAPDTVHALVSSGDLCCVPDGSICEPVEVFAREDDAHEHRAKLQADNPGEDFRVVMNADVTV